MQASWFRFIGVHPRLSAAPIAFRRDQKSKTARVARFVPLNSFTVIEATARVARFYPSACSRSAMMSSGASIPVDSRTRLSRMPIRSRCFGEISRCELITGYSIMV